MWNLLILAAGGAFLTVMILTGLLLRLEGRDVKGKAAISRPLFLAGKAASGLLWGMALWWAAAGMGKPDGRSPFWLEETGAVLFAAGCCLAVAAFFHLGREVRFGLPGGECRLKMKGIYAWFRHPMYTGFHLMALGSCLFVFNALSVACLFLTLWTHHLVALKRSGSWRPASGGMEGICRPGSAVRAHSFEEDQTMKGKGRAFTGLAGGAHYRRWVLLFGMGKAFYRRGIGGIGLGKGMKALDLGCGPGALSYALAEKAHPESFIVGIDLSATQVDCAWKGASSFPCAMEFRKMSMDELAFPDGSFDLVMTSMALHATPPEVRRAAIVETARVLKENGTFLLVDLGGPTAGLLGAVFYPLVSWGGKKEDNRDNRYPMICRACGLQQEEDGYINPFVRRQVFRKADKCTVQQDEAVCSILSIR